MGNLYEDSNSCAREGKPPLPGVWGGKNLASGSCAADALLADKPVPFPGLSPPLKCEACAQDPYTLLHSVPQGW